MQQEHQYLPDTDRLSVLAASILLSYALLPFIRLPEQVYSLSIAGILFEFKANFFTILVIISAGMAAAGTDWLLSDHPQHESKLSYQHWLIPAMTTWVIGVPLSSLAVGPQWWGVFAFGGLLLVLVLVAEYITVDPYDARHAPAAVGLTAVSYALFLILTITLAAAGTRLYVLLPAIGLTVFLVSLRNLNLRLGSRWCFAWSGVTAIIVGQVAAALHYWPLSPLQFGLVILGLAYSLASVAGSVEEGRSLRELWVEPAIMLAILWGMAIALRS
jgi:hypothetical protein